ncbi:MAG TPA: hypothetical protein VFW07_28555 [Parafilimonas sp.]|nr:hypothetical protein [Parafilimonas sp.]
MKAVKFMMPVVLSVICLSACDNNSTTESTSPEVNDSTSTNPASNAEDYHPDQRQHIPVTDSSNTIGTDTISGTEATPNTGTEKSYNTQKGKDSSK